jgi:hypothetical protein
VAGFGIALDAEERGGRVGRHLLDDRCEVDLAEDLPEIALPVLGRELRP